MGLIKYISLFTLVLLVSCKGENQLEVGQKTSMKIDKLFNAGTRVKGEVIEAKFKIENTGDYPLVFGEIKGSCSCTVAEKPEAPILPGEKAVITATVDTESFRVNSEVSKYVTLVANTEPNRVTLRITVQIK